MNQFACLGCGITGETISFVKELCAVCAQKGAHSRHPLADAPPLPSAEIEDIKVKMMQTGWVY